MLPLIGKKILYVSLDAFTASICSVGLLIKILISTLPLLAFDGSRFRTTFLQQSFIVHLTLFLAFLRRHARPTLQILFSSVLRPTLQYLSSFYFLVAIALSLPTTARFTLFHRVFVRLELGLVGVPAGRHTDASLPFKSQPETHSSPVLS
jgi:hypothetical protein